MADSVSSDNTEHHWDFALSFRELRVHHENNVLANHRFFCLFVLTVTVRDLPAAPIVPGTGVKQQSVGDDFEDPAWQYSANLPKSSREQDERERRPWGISKNRRLMEGPHRGTPDLLRRVKTPAGGLPGSEGALLIRTMRAGIPGRKSYQAEQDDLMINVRAGIKRTISVSESPNCVVRVFLPPFDQWENRAGTSFAVRLALRGRGREPKTETYWPGMFISYRGKTYRGKQGPAHLIIRAKNSGHDFRGPDIQQTGWWTLGMSVSRDGMVHYYAKLGVEDLTQADHIASNYCYGNRAQTFKTFFFNILSRNDGRTWSTPWIIDDPQLYLIPRRTRRVANLP